MERNWFYETEGTPHGLRKRTNADARASAQITECSKSECSKCDCSSVKAQNANEHMWMMLKRSNGKFTTCGCKHLRQHSVEDEVLKSAAVEQPKCHKRDMPPDIELKFLAVSCCICIRP